MPSPVSNFTVNTPKNTVNKLPKFKQRKSNEKTRHTKENVNLECSGSLSPACYELSISGGYDHRG